MLRPPPLEIRLGVDCAYSFNIRAVRQDGDCAYRHDFILLLTLGSGSAVIIDVVVLYFLVLFCLADKLFYTNKGVRATIPWRQINYQINSFSFCFKKQAKVGLGSFYFPFGPFFYFAPLPLFFVLYQKES